MEIVQSNMVEMLKVHQQKGLYRQRHVRTDNHAAVSFMTNDYLGFSTNEHLRQLYIESYTNYAFGSGGSPVNGGRSEPHVRLEDKIASLTGCDAAVLFNSGYQANIGVLSLLSRLEIPVLIDKAAHASIYDGIQIGQIAYNRFKHNDLAHLQSQLSAHQLVISEGIFSMSGQIPPLDLLSQMVKANHSGLLVDEAHAFGVLGQTGMGSCEHFQLDQCQVPLRMISFAKGGASSGAAVVGQMQWIDALIQFARPYIYSTSMSPAHAQALCHTLDFVVAANDERQYLTELSSYFNQKAQLSSFPWRWSETPIKQLSLGNSDQAIAMKAFLDAQDILVQLIRPPTVPRIEAGIRVCLTTRHQISDIDRLFDALNKMTDCLC